MRGSKRVIEQLNHAFAAELVAIVEYMTRAEMCDNWGYYRLAEITKTRAFQEMKHAEGLIERILFLDGTPEVGIALKPRIGATVPEQLQYSLEDERGAVVQYNDAVVVCNEEKDDGSRALFEGMIKDEEGHVDWLEAQLHAIEEMGLANYLTQQMKDGK